MKTPLEISMEIFYSQATNGKADMNIKKGAEMIQAYADQQKSMILKVLQDEVDKDYCFPVVKVSELVQITSYDLIGINKRK